MTTKSRMQLIRKMVFENRNVSLRVIPWPKVTEVVIRRLKPERKIIASVCFNHMDDFAWFIALFPPCLIVVCP
jgi:hypothetical protein